MKSSVLLKRAEDHRTSMQDYLNMVNERLRKFLGDEDASVFYQPSDGWCILFGGDASNSPVNQIDIDALLLMTKEDALALLRRNSI